MNDKTIRKSRRLAIVVGLLISPLATNADEKNARNDEQSVNQKSGAARKDITIGGSMVSLDDLRGTAVENKQGDRLGEVEDVVFSEAGEKASHLIIATDNWFDGQSAVVPLSAISYRVDPSEGTYSEWVDNDRVILDLDEETFDSIAQFEKKHDLESYLEQGARATAQALNMQENEVFEPGRNYSSAFVNRSAAKDSPGQSNGDERMSQSASDKSQQQRMRYRSDEDLQRWDRKTVEVDGRTIEANELRGIEVVNFEDDTLGEVEDIVYNADRDAAEYLIISSDNWFDDRFAIVPLSSLTYHEDTEAPHPEDGANWLDDEHLVLDMSEAAFDEMADYDMENHAFSSYLQENRERITNDYGQVWNDYPTVASSYVFVYSVPASPDLTLAGSPNTRNQDNRQGKTSDGANDTSDKSKSISIDGNTLRIDQLKEALVRSSEASVEVKVSDIVIEESSGEAAFLAVSHSSWESDEMGIVPVSKITVRDSSGKSEANSDSAAILEVDLDGSSLKRLKTFTERSELESFLENNAQTIADTFNIDRDDLFDGQERYSFVAEGNRYRTASTF